MDDISRMTLSLEHASIGRRGRRERFVTVLSGVKILVGSRKRITVLRKDGSLKGVRNRRLGRNSRRGNQPRAVAFLCRDGSMVKAEVVTEN